jgi:PAS domain S-box-containing protein
MTRVWSYRPQLLHLGLFILAYVLGCGFAQALAIVPGTGISIWPPSGLFIATLILAPMWSWPWWVLAGGLAELLGNIIWFHSPLPVALLIYSGNALEATIGAWLVNRTLKRSVRLETLQEVVAFVVVGAGIAPMLSATVGSATLVWFGMSSQTFLDAWALWWIGDATGVLIVAPLALVVFQSWGGKAEFSAARWAEACVLGVILLGVATLSLTGFLPFAYIIMPPLLWASVRLEFKGAAVTLALLALITATFTISGAIQFAGDAETQRHNQIMLQLFLAISAFSALIVAAISRQHQLTLQSLRDRERELSQLVDMVPSLLWRLNPSGEPSFFNKRMMDFLGVDGPDAGKLDTSQMAAILNAAIHPDDAPGLAKSLRDSLATGKHFAMDYRLRRADGVYRWMSGRAEPMRDEKAQIIQWYGLSHDIDDQTRLYSDIAEREARIRRLIDSDIIGIVIWDLDGTVIDANDAFLRMIQYEREDVQAGLRWFDITPPKWQTVHAREEAEERAATGKMQAREKEYFRKDGSRVPVLIGAACFEGQSRQGVAYILDLTEHKRAEAALRSREQELSLLVDMVPSYLWRISPDGQPVFFNKRLVDYLGLDVAGLDKPDMSRLDAFIETAIHPDDAVEVEDAFQRSVASGEPLSMKWRMRRADGTYRWMATSAEAMRDQDGSIAQWYGLCHDIDDQLQSEEALRNSKRQLEQMIDAVPINILSYDPEGKLTSASKRYLDNVGAVPDHVTDFEGLARHLAHPDDLPVMLRRALDGFATGTPFVNRFRRRTKDGAYPWIEARAQPLRDASGAIVQWYQVSIDIEDEMRAQEALRESESQLRRLVDALPVQIWAAAADGEPSYLNRRLAEYVGLTLTDLSSPKATRLQMAIQNSVHPDDASAVGQALMHSFTTGSTFTMKYRQRRADGVYRWINGRAEPLRDANGNILQWYGVSFDIDDDVRTQEELRRTQERLAVASQAASLAELSASIAHEVNQPLAAIVANSHACHRWLSFEPPNVARANTVIERLIRDANAAADVVSRIRALFKQSTETRSRATLSSVIAEARGLMAEEAARRRIRMEFHVDVDLPAVTLDSIQIQQVLINLFRNGMDAMDLVEGEKVLEVHAHRAGSEVQTEISDRGRGVESPDRVFEPFFTTKQHGMGMGLAISRSIVEAHGGRLWTEKNEPCGARFIFTLPIAAKETS